MVRRTQDLFLLTFLISDLQLLLVPLPVSRSVRGTVSRTHSPNRFYGKILPRTGHRHARRIHRCAAKDSLLYRGAAPSASGNRSPFDPVLRTDRFQKSCFHNKHQGTCRHRPGEPIGHLRQIIGAEAEEVRDLCDFIRHRAGPRRFDHRPHFVFELCAGGADLCVRSLDYDLFDNASSLASAVSGIMISGTIVQSGCIFCTLSAARMTARVCMRGISG